MLKIMLGDQKRGDYWRVQIGGVVRFDLYFKDLFWLFSGEQIVGGKSQLGRVVRKREEYLGEGWQYRDQQVAVEVVKSG